MPAVLFWIGKARLSCCSNWDGALGHDIGQNALGRNQFLVTCHCVAAVQTVLKHFVCWRVWNPEKHAFAFAGMYRYIKSGEGYCSTCEVVVQLNQNACKPVRPRGALVRGAVPCIVVCDILSIRRVLENLDPLEYMAV